MRDALPADLSARLETAEIALERTNELLHAAMQGPSLPLGSSLLSGCPSVSCGEAVLHAEDATRERAESLGARVTATITPDAGVVPAGALYAVFLSLLRWSLDGVALSGGEGEIELIVWRERGAAWGGGGGRVIIELRDDGAELSRRTDPSKDPHLMLAADVLSAAGGELTVGSRGVGARPGAIVRARCPAPDAGIGTPIGRDDA